MNEHPPLLTLPNQLHTPRPSPTRFATSFAYYGLVMDLQGFGVNIYLIQVIFGAVDLPAKLVGFLVINSLGRRPAQMASLLLAGICILVNGVVPQGEHPRVPWSFILNPIPRFSCPTPKLPLTPSFLSRSVHCPNLPCCAGKRLPGCLLQLHLPLYWGALPHSDPVSRSLVGEAFRQDIPTHIGQTPEHTAQHV